MTMIFRDKVGQMVEVYIDDMVIKSKQERHHIGDLKEVFEILQRHRLRLNANKCAFGVGSGLFLVYLITKQVIEVRPDQIEAVKCLRQPGNPKEVQKLIGMLATLNRFISKFADWCCPFYQILKKWKGLHWDEECDRAFQDLKDYFGRALTLSASKPGGDLYMYLSVSEHAVSVVLLRDNGAQLPVYYISKTLVNIETRYKLRNSVKGQVLADFIAEFSPRAAGITGTVKVRPWRLFVDEASNTTRAGVGIMVVIPEELKLEHSFRLGFRASNNEAKYEALLAGLRVVMDLGARVVGVYSNSLLVVSQVQANFEARDPRMVEYLRLAKQIMDNFDTVKIKRITQGQNRHADSLATLASSIADEVPQLIRVELAPEPSIATRALIVQVTKAKRCWIDPIIEFLSEDRTLEDEKEAARVRRTAAHYRLSADRKLYRRSFKGPYLQCLHPNQARELLVELYGGVCGSHVGGRSLTHRAMTQGFWWLQMRREATEYA
ncbi:uncharacterized protein LOC142640334 [Castanea sativa]|uniref:uncharacterized protein LOC142640334 n=1 Tax=Castanea sativa TaxID=21020 RepID=UPI003F6534B6